MFLSEETPCPYPQEAHLTFMLASTFTDQKGIFKKVKAGVKPQKDKVLIRFRGKSRGIPQLVTEIYIL